MKSALFVVLLALGIAGAAKPEGAMSGPAREGDDVGVPGAVHDSGREGGHDSDREDAHAADSDALRSWVPRAGEFVLVGAGDIATCESKRDESTAALVERVLAASTNAMAFTVGDNVYPDGAPEEFVRCYAPSWGRFLDRTIPVIGNHEYRTQDAAGYFGYFKERAGPVGRGYQSVEHGPWHVVTLNSNCTEVAGGCGADSPQARWLQRDLADHKQRCTVALWHAPRFSSGPHGDDGEMEALWRILDDAGADLVINGHDHIYERLLPMRADGAPGEGDVAGDGLRSIIVGTGGAPSTGIIRARVNSAVRAAGGAGVLVLVLGPNAYRWSFVDARGQVLDQGAHVCR